MTERRILYLDLIGGAAGDMLMAALVDLGAPLEEIRRNVGRLGLEDVRIETIVGRSAGLRARRIDVMVRGALADGGGQPARSGAEADHAAHGPVRPYPVVRQLLEEAGLPAAVAARSLETFRRLAEAEAEAHGVALEEVHFHEVGADDALADVVGVATAVESLQVDEIVVGPVPLGHGLTRGSHGPIPLPPPAVLHVLRGAKTFGTGLPGETVTPTGASLLAAMADRFGSMPAMVLEQVGTGAGHMEWPDRPNVVRAILGRAEAAALNSTSDEAVLETNLDDMSPELFGDLERALFRAGALDVWTTDAQMKKGRTGRVVHALVRRSEVDVMAEVFVEYSTTLGVRVWPVSRRVAERAIRTVVTPFGQVTVKVSPRRHGRSVVAPEHDDCRRQAEAHGVPLRVVYEAALEAAWRGPVDG